MLLHWFQFCDYMDIFPDKCLVDITALPLENRKEVQTKRFCLTVGDNFKREICFFIPLREQKCLEVRTVHHNFISSYAIVP